MRAGSSWTRSAAILWFLLCALYVLKALIQPDDHSVYPIFAQASEHWWQRVSLYPRYEGLDLFRYSPTFAIAMTPFALLPTTLGSVLWNLMSVGVLVAALRTLLRDLLPGEWPPAQTGMFFVFALFGSVRGIWSAQSNTLLLALVLFAAAALAKRRWWAASGLLAAATFVKLWPLALVLLVLALWPRPLIGRLMVAGCGLAAVPFLTAPAEHVVAEYRAWLDSLLTYAPVRWPGQRDGWTLVEQVVDPDGWWLAIQLLTALAVLRWCLAQRRRMGERKLLVVVLAVWVSWQLLFGPATERLTYAVIAPFTAWAVVQRSEISAPRPLAWAAWVLVTLLGSGASERALLPIFPWAPAIQPFGVLLFALWLFVAFPVRRSATRLAAGSG